MPEPLRCPTEDGLLRYLSGTCSAEEDAYVRAHRALCTTCHAWLDASWSEAEELDSAGRPAQGETGGSGEERAPSARSEIVQALAGDGRGQRYEVRFDEDGQRGHLRLLSVLLRSPRALARYEIMVERLCALDHPGLARVLEAGTVPTEDGADPAQRGARPFLVHEWVEGPTLGEYAVDLRRRKRVELVARLCEAVQHAHDLGVTRLELKIDSVRVPQRGVPVVVEPALAPARASAQRGEDPEELGARNDVAALGGLLLEVVVGPIAGDGDPAARVAGDLAAIADRALRDDPTERYPSASALADDLRRHMRHEPVAARIATPGYVLSRLSRRHPLLAALGLVAALGVGYGLYHLAGMISNAKLGERTALAAVSSAESQRDEARRLETAAQVQAERERMEREALESEQVVLRAAEERARQEADAARAAEAALNVEHEEAQEQLLAAEERARQEADAARAAEASLDVEREAAQEQLLAAEERARQEADAARAAQASLDVEREAAQEQLHVRARVAALLGSELGLPDGQAALAAAEARLELELELGPEVELPVRLVLGRARAERGEHELAHEHLSAALAVHELDGAQLGGRLPLELHEQLGRLELATARYEPALEHLQRALELDEGLASFDALTRAELSSLAARALHQLDRDAEALVLLELAVATLDASSPAGDPRLANALRVQADCCGEDSERADLLARALAVDEARLESEDPALVAPLEQLGRLRFALAEPAPASALLARARNLRLGAGGPTDVEAARLAALLVDLELEAGRPELAQLLASDALESLRGELPEEDQRIVRLRLVLGRAYAALELYPQAERELRAAHWLAREADPVRAARAAEELLGVFAAWGQPERAAEFTRLLEEDAG